MFVILKNPINGHVYIYAVPVTDYKIVVINPAQQWLSKTTCMQPGNSNFADDKVCYPRRRTFSEYTCMKRMQYVFVIFN